MSNHDEIKICHMAATAVGANWMVEQLKGLRDQFGYRVCAIIEDGHGPLAARLESEEIHYFALDMTPGLGRRLLNLPLRILKLVHLLRKERIDVVQTHIFTTTMFGRLASWLADTPVRLAMIAGPFHLDAPASREFDRLTHWMETAMIPSCEYTQRIYRDMGIPFSRLPLIYYGSDPGRFDPKEPSKADLRKEYNLSQDSKLVGMVSYIYGGPKGPSNWWPTGINEPIKGHAYLLEAVPRVLEEFPETKFLLIGGPSGRGGAQVFEQLKQLVVRLGIKDSVVFTGTRNDIPDVLRCLDIVVEPSLNENLDGSIESLLMERPTVATRVGGLVDTVRDQETGLLVSPRSSEELAEAILTLLRDPKSARSMGRAGRKFMLDRFTLDRTVADLHELYSRLDPGNRTGYRWWVSLVRMVLGLPYFVALLARIGWLDVIGRVRPRARRPEVQQRFRPSSHKR